VLDFDGNIRASAVERLREEISAVVQVARPEDEVLLRLESQGGMVHTYGLAASQLRRPKSAGIRLTASVDEVAASGGYMMACVAERIIAAPFAIIGSNRRGRPAAELQPLPEGTQRRLRAAHCRPV
jgi:serine protease SohB